MELKQLRLLSNVTRLEKACSVGDYLCHGLVKEAIEQYEILPFHQVDLLSAVANGKLRANGEGRAAASKA